MNFNDYWKQDQEAHGSSTNFKDERECNEFAEDFFNYGWKDERERIIKLIDERIKQYNKLHEEFPKNPSFVDMWTALFDLKVDIGEEIK